jgi:bifunctional DNA-binding transcriptional regulator/antitoxin component of YhaV-PrlF toxin-antitoxin module
MKAKVTERGQVTIPEALCARLGIVPGTVLDFFEEQGRLVAKKTEAVDAVDQVFGRYSGVIEAYHAQRIKALDALEKVKDIATRVTTHTNEDVPAELIGRDMARRYFR